MKEDTLIKMKKQIDEAGLDDSIFKRQQAIISSMTRKERKAPKILNASRKKRIAAGSGSSVQEINQLLKMHRQMGDMIRKMGKSGMGGMMGGGGMGSMMGGMGKAAMGGMMNKLTGGGNPMGGMGGMPGGAGMPDLSKMSPQEIQKMAQEMGIKVPSGKGPFGDKK